VDRLPAELACAVLKRVAGEIAMIGSIHSPTITFLMSGQDALESRVRGEYREMPAMRLTLEQAMRLWSLDRDTCQYVLGELVAEHFLEQDRNGRFTRARRH
jgi:hypothetical protein